MARLRYEGVRKTFGDETVAMDDITLEIRDGEFLVFVGPSGSGKSTFLRVMAGLETPTGGRILIDERDVTELEPRERDLAMVFQAYALYPHKTVRENLEFGLRMRGMGRPERAARVDRIARTLGIEELLDRRPGQLSGGQQQRVALGRALVREPRAFLLDEPLSNLDPALRVQARTEIARLHRSLGATFLYVTHDQEEAMTLGDRVAVLRSGRIEQVAPPMELYRAPATRFVAEFIGSPAMNVVRCRIGPAKGREGAAPADAERRDGPAVAVGPGFRLPLPEGVRGVTVKGEVLVGVRPHDVVVRPADGTGPPPDVLGLVDLVEPRGSDLLVRVRLHGAEGVAGDGGTAPDLALVLPSDRPVGEGERLGLHFPPERLHWFDAGTERRL